MTVEEMIKDAEKLDLAGKHEEIIKQLGHAVDAAVTEAMMEMSALYDGQPLDHNVLSPLMATLVTGIAAAARTSASLLIPLACDDDEKLDIKELERVSNAFSGRVDRGLTVAIASGLEAGCAAMGEEYAVVPANSDAAAAYDALQSIGGRVFTDEQRAKLEAFRAANDVKGAVAYLKEFARKNG